MLPRKILHDVEDLRILRHINPAKMPKHFLDILIRSSQEEAAVNCQIV